MPIVKDIKVLIASSETLIPTIHKSYIEAVGGFKVIKIHGNHSTFFELLDREKPDLIIFDDSLSDVSSTEVISFVRTRQLPIDFIMVTAVNNSLEINQALRNGIFDYILKPFSIERLKDSLRIYREFKQQCTNHHMLNQVDLDRYNISRR